MSTETCLYLLVAFAGGALLVEILRFNAVVSMRRDFRFYFKELVRCARWADPQKVLRDPEFRAFYMQVMHPDRRFDLKQLARYAKHFNATMERSKK